MTFISLMLGSRNLHLILVSVAPPRFTLLITPLNRSRPMHEFQDPTGQVLPRRPSLHPAACHDCILCIG